ncbi:MAG: hypothetical protein JKX94_09495 [Sneathiella sp.]|nr:hypothetical protein [Sneathiella sp.]
MAIFVVSCARSAPDLPPDTHGKSPEEAAILLNISDKDMALECLQIDKERKELSQIHSGQEAKIRSNRTNNQVAGYLGTFFLPAYLATKHNSAAKDKLDAIQIRFDQLYFLGHIKNCK